MVERNTILSAYTMYRHLEQYCTHPSSNANGTLVLKLISHRLRRKFATYTNLSRFCFLGTTPANL